MIDRCTIVGNAGGPGAGGVHAYVTSTVITNTVIAFSTEGPAVVDIAYDHCIIFGNAGANPPLGPRPGNLYSDPLLCDWEVGDLEVCADSPCVATDPENPWGEQVGAYGAGCADCDSPVEESSWGSIKAMYR